VVPVVAAATLAGVVLAAGLVTPVAAALAGGLCLFVSTSLRRLLVRVREAATLAETDPAAARERLRTLVGRETADLSPGQLRSAAVESLAENLADGLVGPLAAYAVAGVTATLFGAGPIVAVAAGCGGAAWVKAVNTLDSMFGYRHEPAGWAPARLDDLVMWLPARASALLLAVVARSPGAPRAASTWLGGVPSPNSGWPMGTIAAALDVRLEKPGVYVLNPGGQLPDVRAVDVALRQVAAAGILAYALAGVMTWS